MRILSYPDTSDTTYVNAYLTSGGNLGYLSSDQVRSRLRLAARRIGADRLGFDLTEISLKTSSYLPRLSSERTRELR
jgi:hypothetical protein